MKDLKNIKLFLLDMDGTIYLDDDVFDGVYDFLKKIKAENKKYIFLTNNSSKSQLDYLNKLKRLNIDVTLDNIFTSGMAMGMYLTQMYKGKSVYLVGTKALQGELEAYNVKIVNDDPDIVLIGFDRELTYEKLEKACKYIDDGKIYLATNTDYVCPIAGGRYIPDCGSICDMIYNATKKRPKFIGKPEPDMINILKKKENLQDDEVLMIGDRLYTDIKSANNANIKSCLVLSGETSIDDYNKSDIKADYVFNSVKDMIDLM